MNIKKLLREGLLLENNEPLTVFHGTNKKHLDSIKNSGLKSTVGYDSSKWYMVSTDFESALFHATPENDGDEVYVFEFTIPLENKKWYGYPNLWPPYERNNNSSWFAIKQPIKKEYITKIHQVSHDRWTQQKYDKY